MRVQIPEKKRRGDIIIKNVDIQLQRGRSTLIIGTSGAGKSTIVSCIMKQGGRYISFENGEFSTPNPRIAYVQQHPVLNKGLTVRESIYYACRFENLFESKRTVNQKVDKYIDMLGLRSREHNKIKKLSGGQQQRVAIAKELIRDADILIADEIDTGLDCGVAHALAETLTRATKEKGIITLVISHNVSNIQLYDKVVVLAKDNDNIGGIAYSGSPKNILRTFGVQDYYSILTKINLKDEGGEGLGDHFIKLANRFDNDFLS